MRNRYGSIHKLGDHHYKISYEAPRNKDGTRHRVYDTVRGTLQDAERALVLLRIKNGDDIHDGDADVSVREYFEDIWLPAVSKTLAPATIAGYRSAMKCHIIPPPFGDTCLSDLTGKRIRTWLKGIENRGAFDKAYAAFRSGINYAIDELELLDESPLPRKVKHPKRERSAPQLIADVDTAKRILDAVRGNRIEPAVICSLCSGMRREESTALFWDDIDDLGRVAIVKTFQEIDSKKVEGPTKTDKSERIVFLPPTAAARMNELRSAGPLVPDRNGERLNPNQLAKEYRLLLESAGIPNIPMKNLRNSFASIVVGAGANPILVDQYMGHSTPKASECGEVLYKHYVVTDAEATREVALAFEKAVFGTGTNGNNVIKFTFEKNRRESTR